MFHLFVFALFLLQVDANFLNSLRLHSSEALKLKCDSLPFRTAFVGTRCYFAIIRELTYNDGSAECSKIITGSKASTDAPAAIFSAMMVNASKYHTGKDSGAKHTICSYDSGYECEGDGKQSKVMSGKCVHLSDMTFLYPEAEAYCKGLGMYMPEIGNDLENSMIRGALDTEPAWISVIYNGASNRLWKRAKNYARFSTCESEERFVRAGSQTGKQCGWDIAAFIDTSGYWTTDARNMDRFAVCVKDADNDFTREKQRCAPMHKWDEDTEECEWTGHKDVCAQVIDFYNRSFPLYIGNFPTNTYTQVTIDPWSINDITTKVIVRRGCMYSAFGGTTYIAGRPEEYLVHSVPYGLHNVPCFYTSTLREAGDGLSQHNCFCDPTEATLNNHVPAPPPKRKCVIEHHVFNQTTQTCEWDLDPKYCGEVITYDGKRQLLEIPNFPINRSFDWNPWRPYHKNMNFLTTVTEIIVRQHCWCTLFNMEGRNTRSHVLPMSGYGKHTVPSYFNQKISYKQGGAQRVLCECLR